MWRGRNKVTTVTKTTVSVVIMLVPLWHCCYDTASAFLEGFSMLGSELRTLHELHSLIISTLSQCWHLHVSVRFWCITNHPKLSDSRKLYIVYFSRFCGSAGQFYCCHVSSLMQLHTDGGSEGPHSNRLAISAGRLLKPLCAPQGLLSSPLW